MTQPIPFLQLITWIGIGACCAFGDSALAQSEMRARRPPLYAADSAQTPRLLATFVHQRAERSLAIVHQAGAASQTVHIGQDIGNGLHVQAIARDHIVLARGAQLSTLRLLGQSTGHRQPMRAPARSATTSSSTFSTQAAPKGGAILRADDIDDVRAACADTTVMAALPHAHKAELSALGLCTPA